MKNKNIVKCMFCNQRCKRGKYDGAGSEIWECRRHIYLIKHYFLLINYDVNMNYGNNTGIYRPKQRQSVVNTILWNHKNEEYRVHFFQHDSKFRIDKIKNDKVIFELPFHPNITPENLDTKIPLWIIFS